MYEISKYKTQREYVHGRETMILLGAKYGDFAKCIYHGGCTNVMADDVYAIVVSGNRCCSGYVRQGIP